MYLCDMKRCNHGLDINSSEYKRIKSLCRRYKISINEYFSNPHHYSINDKMDTPFPVNSKEYRRALRIKCVYGIDHKSFINILESQDHCCDICHQPMVNGWKSCIDHDHSTNQVRGLLCRECNLGLGMFKDSESSLASAIEYIRKHKLYPTGKFKKKGYN